jgi:HEAT repeat protein/cyclophilin family peptidyl-prolyl cis-trans isomerase
MRRLLPFVLAIAFSACVSTPPPAPPTISYEQKAAWIVRLEDQRILRDPAAAAAASMPPSPVTRKKGAPTVAPPATPDLVKLVTDSDARVRRRAALAIGRVGLADGVAPLTQALKDADADVRQSAAFGLGLLADKSAAPALIELLKTDAALPVRGRAAQALGAIGDASAVAPIGELVTAQVRGGALASIQPDDLGYPLSPEAEAFRLGLYALVRLKAYDATAAAILDTGGLPAVRWWPAAYALSRLGDKRALPALQALLKSEGSYTQAFAARGLGGLKDPAAIDLLLETLKKPELSPRVQYRVVEALGAIGDRRAATPLLALLERANVDPNVRLEAVNALGRIKAKPATDRLLDLMGDRWASMRIAAFRALAAADPDTFVGVLSAMDPDADWVVRAANAETLATLPELPNLHATLTAMLTDADQRTIPAVLRALSKTKAPGLETLLLDRLKSDDLAIRTAAADLLATLKPQGAAAALQAAWAGAQGENAIDLRRSLLDALAAIGPDAARDTVKQALQDKDWSVRLKAAGLSKTIDPATDADAAIRPAPTRLDAATYDTLVSPRVSPHIFVDTKKGSIEIELAVLDAPITAANFISLARAGFFNNLRIHRIVPDFVVQDGDPRGDGEGGPNYSIRDELNDLPYLRGTVGMALSGKDTGGSQWFVTMSPQPHLDAGYTVFGRVVKGMEIVDRLQQWDTIDRVRVWDGVQMTALDPRLLTF